MLKGWLHNKFDFEIPKILFFEKSVKTKNADISQNNRNFSKIFFGHVYVINCPNISKIEQFWDSNYWHGKGPHHQAGSTFLGSKKVF